MYIVHCAERPVWTCAPCRQTRNKNYVGTLKFENRKLVCHVLCTSFQPRINKALYCKYKLYWFWPVLKKTWCSNRVEQSYYSYELRLLLSFNYKKRPRSFPMPSVLYIVHRVDAQPYSVRVCDYDGKIGSELIRKVGFVFSNKSHCIYIYTTF